MKIDLRDIGLLMLSGFTQLQCREICEATLGYKLSRINLYRNQAQYLVDWCHKYNLFIDCSDFYVQEFICEEGKGNWSNQGEKTFDINGCKFYYISRNKEEVQLAKSAEVKEEFDAKLMGNLLKIPECCTEKYLVNREVVEKKYFDDYAIITTKNTLNSSDMFNANWKTNYLSQYFGYSLIHHFPCTWNCQNTIDRADKSIEIMNSVSPNWVKTFQENLRGLLVFENGLSVHFIKALPETGAKEVLFKPNQIVSTNTTELSKKLREYGNIRWNSPFSFNIRELEDLSKYHNLEETTVIPFL
ncbi:hypothetical protein RW25_28445 [Bacillus sp. L_1B0_8]|uniref:hypothetical protein n=1 Tax=unclassified Bacillus (in: firmicutes) TaxID=185979 RepID=UPI0005B74FE4|nr:MULTISPECIES: hypothetical protein [unclassified Bacillus (in: firmicutes)]KIQ77604.1 hypothetical protein RT27_30875 [Bacillus sp. L_1B0_5]KIQ78081.1 hypothetical protein RW25_28445 [Bacillus sp. L_1B0_8]